MRWRYQLMQRGDDLSVHEVYFDDSGIVAWTEDPTTFGGDTIEDVVWSLEAALKDIQALPILSGLEMSE